MAKEVVLTNQAVLSLLKRGDVLNAFPQMKAIKTKLKRKNGGCRCRSNANKNGANAVQDFKNTIANWDTPKKLQLKKILGVDVVKIYVGKKLVQF